MSVKPKLKCADVSFSLNSQNLIPQILSVLLYDFVLFQNGRGHTRRSDW